METVRERILQTFSSFATNINKFSDGDTALRNRLSRQLKDNAAVTIDTVNAVLSVYPDVSAEWLIRGEGEMLISDNLPKFHGEETDAELDLHAEIARKEIEIQKLTDEINRIKHEYIRLESLKDYFENRCDEQAETIHTLRDELSKYTTNDTQEKRKDII